MPLCSNSHAKWGHHLAAMDSTAMATANAVLTSPGGSPKTLHFATLVTSYQFLHVPSCLQMIYFSTPLFYNASYVLGSSEKSCQGPGQHGATVVPCVAKKEPCKSDAKSCRAINLWMMNSLPGLDAKKQCSQQNGPSSVTSWCQGGFHANFHVQGGMQHHATMQYPSISWGASGKTSWNWNLWNFIRPKESRCTR